MVKLRDTYDSAINPSKITLGPTAPTSLTYCIQSVVGQATFKKDGPGAEISPGACT
jgi:hypothetical protein